MGTSFFCHGGAARIALERLYNEEITVSKCVELLHAAEAERRVNFAEWLSHEMPAGTVIGDPAWWAPRILRAADLSVIAKTQQGGSK